MRFHRLATLLIVLVAMSQPAVAAAGGVGTAPQAQTQQVTLTISVTDKFNSGISGATVTAEWDGGSKTAETVSNGMALMDVPKGATVTLSVDHHAYVRNNPVVVEDATQQEVPITVFRKGSATVKVSNPEGKPVANTRVLMYKRGDVAARGQTDDDGVFSSGTVERGEYHVVAVKPGYYKNETDVEVAEGTEIGLGIEQGTKTVEISVKDSHFSPPQAIEGAKIEIEGVGTLNTGGNGEQTAAVPVNSEVKVTATKSGYTSKTRTLSVGESSMDVQFTITRKNLLNMSTGSDRVIAGEKVRLEVTDEYGETVEGATIYVDGSKVGTTDANGVYQATLSSPGEHSIRAKSSGVSSATKTVEAFEPGNGGGTPTASSTGTSTGDLPVQVPGFGLSGALLGAVVAMLLLTRRE